MLVMTISNVLPSLCSAAEADAKIQARQSDEDEFQKEIERVRTLVLPLQKRWAREFIKKNPDSPNAKIAQELLDEYNFYDTQAELERQKEKNRTQIVKQCWDNRRLPPGMPDANPIRITNLTDVPVLYQIKGPSSNWSGPYRLRERQTHQFKYPMLYRRITQEGLSVYSLSLGGRYVFRRPTSGGLPRLFSTQ